MEKTNAILTAPFFKSLPSEEQTRLLKNMEFYKKSAHEKAKQVEIANMGLEKTKKK
jgi:hypothetical protein